MKLGALLTAFLLSASALGGMEGLDEEAQAECLKAFNKVRGEVEGKFNRGASPPVCNAPGVKTSRSGAVEVDFCVDPVSAICGSDGDEIRSRHERIGRFKNEAKKHALTATLKKYNLGSMFMGDWPRDISIFDYYQSELMSYMGRRTDQAAESKRIAKEVKKIRSYLSKAIHSSVRDKKARREMLAMLKETEFLSVPDTWPDELLEDQNAVYHFLGSYEKRCGPDFLVSNAFAYWSRVNGKKKHYVVLCPGYLISMLDNPENVASSLDAMARNLLHVTAHEFGHKLVADSKGKYWVVYDKYLACLRSNYGNFRGEKLKIGGEYELIPDFWSAQVAGMALKKIPAKRMKERLALLRTAWGGLCGTPSIGPYQTGEYRIGVLLRSDPLIHKLMGCQKRAAISPYSQGCTLNGAKRLKSSAK